MKKLILPLLALTMMLATTKTNAQALEQGNVIIDAYYGFPNLYSTVFEAAYESSNSTGLTLGSQGPLGIRAEYLITDKVGFGIDLGMNSSSISYSEADINNSNIIYDYKFKTSKIGAIFTFNYHFVENDKLDAYFVVGGGYGNRTFKFTSTDPNYIEESVESLIPISYKIGVGMRYFFTENIGANLALGLGQGGLVNAGISAKF
jgi:outer membrane protein W